MDESRPKRRWYHITPDRLIVGLLAVEVFLLLSEWFQWFAFNEKKGWTVLIAVAAVCLVVVVMLLWLVVSLLSRLRFQFSLRSLVVLVVAVAVPLGWFGVKLREAERQRRAVEAIREMGGYVVYHDDAWGEVRPKSNRNLSTPTWLRRLVGEDFCRDVVIVSFAFSDTGVRQPLEQDDLLLFVQRLTKLEYLNFSSTQVTQEGIKQLQEALPNCDIKWDGNLDQP